MPPRKKSSPATTKRSRPAASKRKKNSQSSERFWIAFFLAAFTAFLVASCSFNPQWRDAVREHLPDWEMLPLPGQENNHTAPRASGDVVTTSFAQCRQFFPNGQTPVLETGTASQLRELCFTSFAVLHSGASRTPVFVAERLNRETLSNAKGLKRTDRFYADARLPRAERSELSDYSHSGYSRGHMAPAGDMSNPEAMAQSFSLANMVPQNQRHNSGPWSKIEDDTRKYAMRAQGDVYVFTGPVFGANPATIGSNKVHVPDTLFKLVYDTATGRSWVHWQQNGPKQDSIQPITYAEFVRRTGLHLLPGIQ